VVRRCVWSKNLVNEETLVHWKLSRQKQTNMCKLFCRLLCLCFLHMFSFSTAFVIRVLMLWSFCNRPSGYSFSTLLYKNGMMMMMIINLQNTDSCQQCVFWSRLEPLSKSQLEHQVSHNKQYDSINFLLVRDANT